MHPESESNQDKEKYKMFGPKMGTWSVESKTDTRWNKLGRALGLVCENGPKEMKDWIEECKKIFGEPPKDLTWSFFKD
jgi:hypothetical protein